MKIACDTGGTFTDLVVEGAPGQWQIFKAATNPEDPAAGVLAVAGLAADQYGLSLPEFLGCVSIFVHGTTHAINALITRATARTALLVTAGHPDVLVLREGGRADPFEHRLEYPPPYVPRRLTFEVPERIDAAGRIVRELDLDRLEEIVLRLRVEQVEAIAICFLWSIVNPAHERLAGEFIAERLPTAHVTLSHAINATPREFRRASSAAIDASLKPTMSAYLGGLEARLRAKGFHGRLLVSTSQGGMVFGADAAARPITTLNSGPAMAPVAGRLIGMVHEPQADVIVADTGGTTFDVSLVRGGRIPVTREMWIGEPFRGHFAGYPSVDVRSIGAGGGSIAWVDEGGLLRVGPQSAGARPGPACYGRGGVEPTLTDACAVLGYFDANSFLAGELPLDVAAAERAVSLVAGALRIPTDETALAILELATQNMVAAVEDITVSQGIDPKRCVLIGGGGAAGLNAASICARLGCRRLLLPDIGAALSAAGGLASPIQRAFEAVVPTSSRTFHTDRIQRALDDLMRQAQAFLERVDLPEARTETLIAVDARYERQAWEISVPVAGVRIDNQEALDALYAAFHVTHEALFGFSNASSVIEFGTWSVTARAEPAHPSIGQLAAPDAGAPARLRRQARFSEHGSVDTPVFRLLSLAAGVCGNGPALIDAPYTTLVVPPGMRFKREGWGVSVEPCG